MITMATSSKYPPNYSIPPLTVNRRAIFTIFRLTIPQRSSILRAQPKEAGPSMAYTEQQVRDLIQRGENDQVELKADVRDAALLARIISGFANGSGGIILIGAQSPQNIPGCDRSQLVETYEAARKQLNQTQVGSLDF